MDELVLKEYFNDEISAEELSDSLIGSHIKIADQISSYEISEMSCEYQLFPKHIKKLCADVISKRIDPESLQIIAFALVSSENFNWDCNESLENDVMDAILNEWSSPEINYPLTLENIKKCMLRLEVPNK